MHVKINNFLVQNQVQSKQEILDGINYSVFPVIMMTEGVHAGSGGPVLYTQAELQSFYQTWNGTPVTLGHPTIEGSPVSANQPEFYQTKVVGKVFNTSFEDGKLKAEVWLQEDKTNILAPALLNGLRTGMKLDVSTGLFDDGVKQSGVFNGEEYQAIAKNIRPDHLALLPGETGACSWADGCGVRANQGGKMKRTKEPMISKEEFIQVHAAKKEQASFQQVMDALRAKVYALDIQGERYCYVKEAWPDKVVYSVENRAIGVKETMYQRTYSLVDGNVEWTSDPILVEQKTTYEPITNNKENKMKTMRECCPAKVDELIKANAKFTQADQEMLLNMSEDAFARVIDLSAPTIVEKEVIKEVKVNAEPKAVTFDDLLANADPGTRESIQYGQELVKKERDSFISRIKANKSNAFSDAELNAFDLTMLSKLAKTAAPVVNYMGDGHRSAPFIAEDVEPLPETSNAWVETK
jgi:hypothetical protein